MGIVGRRDRPITHVRPTIQGFNRSHPTNKVDESPADFVGVAVFHESRIGSRWKRTLAANLDGVSSRELSKLMEIFIHWGLAWKIAFRGEFDLVGLKGLTQIIAECSESASVLSNLNDIPLKSFDG